MTAACDPIARATIAVRPQPGMSSDSATTAAFSLVARVANKYGLAPTDPSTFRGGAGWRECFYVPALTLCGKVKSSETYFDILQMKTTKFSPRADSLWREVTDSLRAQFGAIPMQDRD